MSELVLGLLSYSNMEQEEGAVSCWTVQWLQIWMMYYMVWKLVERILNIFTKEMMNF